MVMATWRGQRGCIVSLQAENTWITEIAPQIVTQIANAGFKTKKYKTLFIMSVVFVCNGVCRPLMIQCTSQTQPVCLLSRTMLYTYIIMAVHILLFRRFSCRSSSQKRIFDWNHTSWQRYSAYPTVYTVKNERCTRIHEFNDTIHEWMPQNGFKMQR